MRSRRTSSSISALRFDVVIRRLTGKLQLGLAVIQAAFRADIIFTGIVLRVTGQDGRFTFAAKAGEVYRIVCALRVRRGQSE